MSAACIRDVEDVIRSHIAVHDPRLPRGELALDGCPLAAGSCGQAELPTVLVQFYWPGPHSRYEVATAESTFFLP